MLFMRKLSQRNVFVHTLYRVIERERDTVQFTEHRDCSASSMCCDCFILEANVRESLSTTRCVKGKICFKEIMSNTRLDQFYIFILHGFGLLVI